MFYSTISYILLNIGKIVITTLQSLLMNGSFVRIKQQCEFICRKLKEKERERPAAQMSE